jgi:ATP-dependent Clp protease adaptor protein ClpS
MLRAVAPTTIPEQAARESTALAPRWHVVLLDDDEHTYAYVIEMLGALFGHPPATAYRMAQEVDRTGRVLVWTGAREVAEFKQERIHAYGADPRLRASKGSMSAVLEPAD